MNGAKTRFFLVVLLLAAVARTGAAPAAPKYTLYTPGPAYPKIARATNITGSGVCEVVFDGSGHVGTALMKKSTGSNILDRNTVGCARRTWTGKPRTRIDIPIVYQMPKPVVRTVDHPPTVPHLPIPPYPYEARAAHAVGSGRCRIVLDASGYVSTATMVKSTGYDILDNNTTDWAKLSWTGPPGKEIMVPVIYRLY